MLGDAKSVSAENAAAGGGAPEHMKLRRALSTAVRVSLHGEAYSIPPLWLKLNDPTRITANGQRTFEIADEVANGAAVRSHSFDEHDGLRVTWDDGTQSSYPRSWLSHQLQRRVRLQTLAQAHAEGQQAWDASLGDNMPDVAYDDLVSPSASGVLAVSSHLARYGLAFIRGVPTEPGTVEMVGNLLGNVRRTNYGTLFDVIDRGATGKNLADTNCRIRAHTDNPYRDPFPTVQLLHCLKNADEGGATTFTDGFAAAAALKAEDPEAFGLLASVKLLFEYRDPANGVLLQAEAPTLTVDADGTLRRVCHNNRSFAGWPGTLPPDEVEAYYRAWARFDALCNADERVLRAPLRPGDLAIFYNSRVMHGREEYTSGPGRHIQGCYIDHDATQSHVAWAAAGASSGASQ